MGGNDHLALACEQKRTNIVSLNAADYDCWHLWLPICISQERKEQCLLGVMTQIKQT